MFTCTSVDDVAAPASGCFCCQPTLRSAAGRITRELSRRGMLAGAASSLAGLGFAPAVRAAPPQAAAPIVFANFLLFDGKAAALRGGVRLLVVDGRIKQIASGDPSPPEGARLIDCGG